MSTNDPIGPTKIVESKMDPNKIVESTISDSQFDPKVLSLRSYYRASAQKRRDIIPVRTPDQSWFVRTNPDPDSRVETQTIEVKAGFSTVYYTVNPIFWGELAIAKDLSPKLLVSAITIDGTFFLWPIRFNLDPEREDPYCIAADIALEVTDECYARVKYNAELRGVEAFPAMGDFPDPVWPDLTMKAILATAFKGHHIDTLDHPVVRKLQGRQR